jgi:hypothetical protein
MNRNEAYEKLIESPIKSGNYLWVFERPQEGTNLGKFQILYQSGVMLTSDYIIEEENEQLTMRIRWASEKARNKVVIKRDTGISFETMGQYVYFQFQDFLNLIENGQLTVEESK